MKVGMYYILFFIFLYTSFIFTAELNIAKIFPANKENRSRLSIFRHKYKDCFKYIVCNKDENLQGIEEVILNCDEKVFFALIEQILNKELYYWINSTQNNCFKDFCILGFEDYIIKSIDERPSYLEKAIVAGNLGIADFLIQKGSNINQISKFDEYNRNLFVMSIHWGDNINLDDFQDKESGLNYINIKRIALTEELLKSGADVNNLFKGKNALKVAVEANNLDIVQMMIYHKVSWEGSEFEKNITSAFLLPAVQLYILDDQRAVNAHLYRRHSQLCMSGETIKLLFNSVRDGSKVLGNMSIVSQLYKQGYYSFFVDENNDTIFDIAIKNNDKAMLITLLGQTKETKDAITRKNWRGLSPLDKLIHGFNKSTKMLGIILNIFATPITKPLSGIQKIISES